MSLFRWPHRVGGTLEAFLGPDWLGPTRSFATSEYSSFLELVELLAAADTKRCDPFLAEHLEVGKAWTSFYYLLIAPNGSFVGARNTTFQQKIRAVRDMIMCETYPKLKVQLDALPLAVTSANPGLSAGEGEVAAEGAKDAPLDLPPNRKYLMQLFDAIAMCRARWHGAAAKAAEDAAVAAEAAKQRRMHVAAGMALAAQGRGRRGHGPGGVSRRAVAEAAVVEELQESTSDALRDGVASPPRRVTAVADIVAQAVRDASVLTPPKSAPESYIRVRTCSRCGGAWKLGGQQVAAPLSACESHVIEFALWGAKELQEL